MYALARGPLLWIALGVFALGMVYRIAITLKSSGKGPDSPTPWLNPLRGDAIRSHPVMTLVSFVFHACLLLTPVFVMGHAVLWRESWGVTWWSMPEGTAHLLTVVIVAGVVFFGLQWITVPEVRRKVGWAEWLLWVLVMAPFLTGFLARQQVLPYEAMVTLHVVSGALWLVVIPFTRLFKMLWFGLSRAFLSVN